MKHSTSTRLLLLLLALGMVFVLSACGDKDEPSEPTDASASESESESTPEEEPEEIVENAVERPELAEKIAAGVARNKDTVGWLYLPNTDIDDAVLQSTNNEYYLRLTEDKVYDIYGCYFMDYESVPQTTHDKLARNNVIYGHSDLRDNKDGKDFSQLFRYLDIDFLKENPYIFYSTREEEMTWQVFAVFKTHISFEYHWGQPDDTRYMNIIDEAKLRSEYVIDVPITKNDKILTLSTCLAKDNYRLVVMAKLLPAEKQLPPTMEAEKNPTPKVS